MWRNQKWFSPLSRFYARAHTRVLSHAHARTLYRHRRPLEVAAADYMDTKSSLHLAYPFQKYSFIVS